MISRWLVGWATLPEKAVIGDGCFFDSEGNEIGPDEHVENIRTGFKFKSDAVSFAKKLARNFETNAMPWGCAEVVHQVFDHDEMMWIESGEFEAVSIWWSGARSYWNDTCNGSYYDVHGSATD